MWLGSGLFCRFATAARHRNKAKERQAWGEGELHLLKGNPGQLDAALTWIKKARDSATIQP
jgi:hypothetical protein